MKPAPAAEELFDFWVREMTERVLAEIERIRHFPLMPDGKWWKLDVQCEDERLLWRVREHLPAAAKLWIGSWRVLDGSPAGKVMI